MAARQRLKGIPAIPRAPKPPTLNPAGEVGSLMQALFGLGFRVSGSVSSRFPGQGYGLVDWWRMSFGARAS